MAATMEPGGASGARGPPLDRMSRRTLSSGQESGVKLPERLRELSEPLWRRPKSTRKGQKPVRRLEKSVRRLRKSTRRGFGRLYRDFGPARRDTGSFSTSA